MSKKNVAFTDRLNRIGASRIGETEKFVLAKTFSCKHQGCSYVFNTGTQVGDVILRLKTHNGGIRVAEKYPVIRLDKCPTHSG